jgi:hypothetical protein
MSEDTTPKETPKVPTVPIVETKTPVEKDVDTLEKIEDSNPKTWINEDLWKTFMLMALFYGITALFKAGSVNIDSGTVNWSFAAFWLALDGTMMPLFGAAIRNQVMKGMNQKLQDQNRAFAIQKKDYIDENSTLQTEIKTLKQMNETTKEELYKARAELNAKCETLEAIKEANDYLMKKGVVT